MKPKISELAKSLGVSVRRVAQLRGAGMPCHNIAAAVQWRDAQAGRQRAAGDSAEELRQRRIALLKQQERRARLEADQRAGELVERAAVYASSARIGTELRLRLMEGVRNSLPPQLEGLPAAQISKILRQWAENLLQQLYDNFRSDNLLETSNNHDESQK